MYQTNLSYTQLKNYLTLLTSHGLLSDNSTEFATTDKGLRFLDAFARLCEALQDESHSALNEVAAENIEEIRIIHMTERRIMKSLLVRP
jgi:hypothetical protein